MTHDTEQNIKRRVESLPPSSHTFPHLPSSHLSPMDRPSGWNSLPTDIQLSILSLLPVSTLIACTYISPSLRSTIQSRPFTSSYRRPPPHKRRSAEIVFLFSKFEPTSFVAYNSSSDSWSSLPVPPNLLAVQFYHGPFVLAHTRHGRDADALLVFNPLSPTPNPELIPPVSERYLPFGFFTRPDSPTSHFMIVAVTTTNPARSQLYDSALGRWRFAGVIHQAVWMYGSGVFMEDDGLFYGFGDFPASILTLDIATSIWSFLELNLQPLFFVWPHLFGFSGRLFFAAGVLPDESIDSMGIWELDRTSMNWTLACLMPDEHFATFSTGGLWDMKMVDCGGLVCFYNFSYPGKTLEDSMVMYDLLAKRWWRPRQCPFPKVEWYNLHAVEPCIDLVWGRN